jgi:hypothetical protein
MPRTRGLERYPGQTPPGSRHWYGHLLPPGLGQQLIPTAPRMSREIGGAVKRRQARTSAFILCLGAASLLCLAQAALAQQSASAAVGSTDDVSRKARRKLARVSKRADFAGTGLLQFEYGYDGDFRQPGADGDQTATASLLFNATEDLQLEFDFETVHALTTGSSQTATGIGDANASAQFTALSEAQHRPSVALSYLVKLPTADAGGGLGTGRIDHKLGVLVSRKVRATDVDFNASLLLNGNPATGGRDTGYQLALGVSHGLTRSFSLQGELFGETLDTDQPRGLFVQAGLTYHPSTRASFDVGVRAGLSSNAPRFGVVAGVSLALTNLYHGAAPATARLCPGVRGRLRLPGRGPIRDVRLTTVRGAPLIYPIIRP